MAINFFNCEDFNMKCRQCKQQSTVIYLGKPLCDKHWVRESEKKEQHTQKLRNGVKLQVLHTTNPKVKRVAPLFPVTSVPSKQTTLNKYEK